MESKMYFKNGIIHTQAYYREINEQLESLGITTDDYSELMDIAFFYDSLIVWNEEEGSSTGIRLSSGDRFVIPYLYSEFCKFIDDINAG
jgi:hypothetical protein